MLEDWTLSPSLADSDIIVKYQVPAVRPVTVYVVTEAPATETDWVSDVGEVPYKMRYPVRSLSAVPSLFSIGCVHSSVTELATGVTVIVKGGNDAVVVPSETLITMLG